MRTRTWLLPAAAAAVAFAVHAALNPGYGFFRDELYFIICGRHPALGYVDQPPLVPLLAALSQSAGVSLFALRLVPAIFCAASIFVTCRIVQELEGGGFAQILAAAAVFFAPVLTTFGGILSTDTPGLWLWPLAALLVLRLTRGADPRAWLGVGAALGIAFQSKYAVVFFAAALLAGVALTPERRIYRTPWFAAGMLLGAAIALPNVVWQAAHAFPILELLRNGQHGKNVVLAPGQYLLQQVFLLNPVLTIVALLGLAWVLFRAPLRFLGYAYLLLLAAMIALHGKDYYPADVYPYLFAAGAVPVERWTQRARFVSRPAVLAIVTAAGMWLLPFALPVMSEAHFAQYRAHVLNALGAKPAESEHHKPSPLGQEYADMHGWPQLAGTVAGVYATLSPQDRARVAIVASNYGEAAAIDFFGRPYGLPPALSGHNQYFLWGTHGRSGDVLIDVGGDCGAGAHLFRHAERAATFSAPYSMPYESDLPIMLCRGIKRPLATVWPAVKMYI